MYDFNNIIAIIGWFSVERCATMNANKMIRIADAKPKKSWASSELRLASRSEASSGSHVRTLCAGHSTSFFFTEVVQRCARIGVLRSSLQDHHGALVQSAIHLSRGR